MKKRLLALVLALVMVVTILPASVLADEPGVGRAVNGYYDVSGNWVPGGTGTTIDSDTGIELSKTAEPVSGNPNQYTISL